MNKISKAWAFLGLAVVVGAGAYVWDSSRGDKDAASIPTASTNVEPSKSSGHKWFSTIETKPASVSTTSATFSVPDPDGRTLDLHGLTVSQYVKSLYGAANKGDAKAAYKIYAAETVCANLSKEQRELANLPVNSDKGFAEMLESEIKIAQVACADFNISPKERIDYLHAAAQSGEVMALLMSAQEVPEGIDPHKPLDMNDPRTAQWQKDSVNYLTQAATKGSSAAMENLSAIYEHGNLGSPNFALALTYELAAQLQRHPSADIPDNAPSISRMTSQLSPDQIATARANAAAMIKRLASRNAPKQLASMLRFI